MKNMEFSLWDCPGQHAFYDNYFNSQRLPIFSDTAALVYVFDATSKDTEKDLKNFENSINALKEFSPEAKVFVLSHKTDLVPLKERYEKFEAFKESVLKRSQEFEL